MRETDIKYRDIMDSYVKYVNKFHYLKFEDTFIVVDGYFDMISTPLVSETHWATRLIPCSSAMLDTTSGFFVIGKLFKFKTFRETAYCFKGNLFS